MSTEIWENPNDPKPEKTQYPIGTDGWQLSTDSVSGFFADVFREIYPILPISSIFLTASLITNPKSTVPTYGYWGGPEWASGIRSSKHQRGQVYS